MRDAPHKYTRKNRILLLTFLSLAYHKPFQVAHSMGGLSHEESIFWWSRSHGLSDYTFSRSGITGQTRFILERGDLFDTFVFTLYSHYCC